MSTMILKLMSPEDKPDDNPSKGCRIVCDVVETHYYLHEESGKMRLDVHYTQPHQGGMKFETFVLDGNAYLMNEQGKTINSFAATPHPSC